MRNEDVENMLNRMPVPEPDKTMYPHEMKMPLLSYRKSSKAGLWLLLVPLTFILTVFLKAVLGMKWSYLDFARKLFASMDDNPVLTYLIPVIFVGLPLLAMILNMLAICHFHQNRKMKELIVTIKYRPVNIVVFLLSFAVLIYFLLPDNLSF